MSGELKESLVSKANFDQTLSGPNITSPNNLSCEKVLLNVLKGAKSLQSEDQSQRCESTHQLDKKRYLGLQYLQMKTLWLLLCNEK